MQLPKIQRERESTAELVTRELMRHLSQSDKIMAGERLPSERELAEAFGVGRAAVREALRSLSLLGLVDIRPGAGSYLVPAHEELVPRLFELGLLLGEKSVTEIVETRALIEIAVAGLAATRRDQSQLDQLRDILKEMSSVVDDPNAFADLDIAFHLLLAESARNRTLVGLLSSLQGLLRVWIVRVKTTHYNEDFVKPHTDVFEAVKAGDARRAEAMMRVHMDEAWRRLESTLPAD